MELFRNYREAFEGLETENQTVWLKKILKSFQIGYLTPNEHSRLINDFEHIVDKTIRVQ